MNTESISEIDNIPKDLPKKIKQEKWTYDIFWQGIKIHLVWTEEYFTAFDFALAHLEIRTDKREAIPITETGYLSHFCDTISVEALWGPAEYVLDWLEDAWCSKKRNQHIATSKV